jgi:hypothetical protein
LCDPADPRDRFDASLRQARTIAWATKRRPSGRTRGRCSHAIAAASCAIRSRAKRKPVEPGTRPGTGSAPTPTGARMWGDCGGEPQGPVEANAEVTWQPNDAPRCCPHGRGDERRGHSRSGRQPGADLLITAHSRAPGSTPMSADHAEHGAPANVAMQGSGGDRPETSVTSKAGMSRLLRSPPEPCVPAGRQARFGTTTARCAGGRAGCPIPSARPSQLRTPCAHDRETRIWRIAGAGRGPRGRLFNRDTRGRPLGRGARPDCAPSLRRITGRALADHREAAQHRKRPDAGESVCTRLRLRRPLGILPA